MTPVRYHEAAEDELLNEIGYLELRARGLGRRFFAEVRRAEGLIAQFPADTGRCILSVLAALSPRGIGDVSSLVRLWDKGRCARRPIGR